MKKKEKEKKLRHGIPHKRTYSAPNSISHWMCLMMVVPWATLSTLVADKVLKACVGTENREIIQPF
jgi:hypothetical protein